MITAIVLAGGASSRFGSDKLAAIIDGRPLLAHAVERAGAAADQVVVVLAPDAPMPPLPEAVVIARDDVAHQGPLAGLVAGLAATRTEIAVVLGGDMPRLDPAVLRLLADTIAQPDGPDAAVLEADPPTALPMAVRVAPALAAARRLLAADRRALRGILAALHATTVPAAAWCAIDPDGHTLDDIDLPTDR